MTEDEVKAAFDEKVAKQKESYASVDAFVNDYVNESEILYTPENVRLMECIFVASVEGEATEDEATADEATADEATVSEATAGEAADIASLTGYAKAKAIAAAIAGGADFEETMRPIRRTAPPKSRCCAATRWPKTARPTAKRSWRARWRLSMWATFPT